MKYAITAATGHFGQLAYHYLREVSIIYNSSPALALFITLLQFQIIC